VFTKENEGKKGQPLLLLKQKQVFQRKKEMKNVTKGGSRLLSVRKGSSTAEQGRPETRKTLRISGPGFWWKLEILNSASRKKGPRELKEKRGKEAFIRGEWGKL